MDLCEKKVLLIINPVAGKQTIQPHIAEVIRIFMDAGYITTSMVTSSHGEATELTARYGKDFDLIVCAGGDGTLHEVLQGLGDASIDIPLGYIPCGTTNDFAHSYGLATDIAEAARNIVSGRSRRCDVGRYGSHYFTYLASFGAFTWMGYSTDQARKNKYGQRAYVFDAVKEHSRLKPIHMKLTLNGVPYEDDYIFGAVANTSSIVGIIELPEGMVDPYDGKFEVVLIKAPKTVRELETIVHSVLTQDYSCPLIQISQAKDIWVDNPKEFTWSLDGESSGVKSSVHITPVHGFMTLCG